MWLTAVFGAHDRYTDRVRGQRAADKPLWLYYAWWVVHNCVAHPLIGVAPVKAFFDFHDFTSGKINQPDD